MEVDKQDNRVTDEPRKENVLYTLILPRNPFGSCEELSGEINVGTHFLNVVRME